MSTAILETTFAAHQSALVRLVEGHLAELAAEVQADHANVRTELVAHAASAERMVSETIEHCLTYHHGECCDADPNECLDVQVAIAAADSAAMMVAAWLVVAGNGTFTPQSEEDALDAAFHLVAEAAALEATAEDDLTWDEVLCFAEGLEADDVSDVEEC